MKVNTSIIILLIIIALSQNVYSSDQQLNRESLDTVWQTVSAYHYDSTFGGLDWEKIHTKYKSLIKETDDDDAAIGLMNEMLKELKLSHYAVFRPKNSTNNGNPLFSEASSGINTRIINNEAYITSIRPGFPADLAKLKMGYKIIQINDIKVDELISETFANRLPHESERSVTDAANSNVLSFFYGKESDSIKLIYQDENNLEHDVVLSMQKRGISTIIDENFPPIYVEFDAFKLNSQIGYIRFSAVLPPVDSLFLDALDKMGDIKGLIIDIRGNPGGMHEIGEKIAGKFIEEKTLFSIFKYRDSTINVSIEPEPPIFKGPIVILIDVMNASASERFSGCMQSIGRATIIGNQSPGSVGPAEFKKLPNEATLMYLIAQSLTPDNKILEGNGITPDIEVSLKIEDLNNQIDTQIETAVQFLSEKL